MILFTILLALVLPTFNQASESPCGKTSTAGCDPAKASCPHHPKIDICYKVTKASQSKGRSCWAASAASLLGTSSNICIDESAIAQLAGHGLTKLASRSYTDVVGTST